LTPSVSLESKGANMHIGNALEFIKRGFIDGTLRNRLNAADTCDALQEILADEGLSFTQHEFENAFNSLLVKCQRIEAAGQLQEFKMWWEMLQQFNGVAMCQHNCSSCCQ
jgi:hypothetical protein